jgi:hypothetical protein
MAVPPPAVTVVMVMTVTMPMIVVVSLCAGIDRVSRFAKWGYWRRDGAGCCRKSQTAKTYDRMFSSQIDAHGAS